MYTFLRRDLVLLFQYIITGISRFGRLKVGQIIGNLTNLLASYITENKGTNSQIPVSFTPFDHARRLEQPNPA